MTQRLPGFTAWSRKAGVWYCEPPVEILAGMLFLRVHLDDQEPENDAMQIAPGTHRLGGIDYAASAPPAPLTWSM